MIILVGKTASGKTVTSNVLNNNGFNRVVTYTSRKPRDGEVHGKDYYFVTKQQFLNLKRKGFFAETTEYTKADEGTVYYGSSKNCYIHSSDRNIIILNPIGLRSLKDALGTKQYFKNKIVYFKIAEEDMRERLSYRGDDQAEVERRISQDNEDFKGIEDLVNITLDCNNKKTPEEFANIIMAYVSRKDKKSGMYKLPE